VVTQQATINQQNNDKVWHYTIGGDIHHFSYRQEDLLKDSLLRYQYVNFAPRADVRYTLNPYHSFTLKYSANTQQPSINQLQPVQNNNDPLHIVIGNPNLHPSLMQHLGLGYAMLKPIVFNLGLNFGLTNNNISTKVFTDSLGRQISQAVNVSGTKSTALFVNLSKNVKPIDLSVGVTGNVGYSRTVSYVGELLSNNDTYNATGGLNMGKYVADKYNFFFSSTVSFFSSRSSISTAALTQYWTQNYFGLLSFFPAKGLELNTSINYSWRQKTSAFGQDLSTLLWNAHISKTLLSNRLTIRCQVNDILGQNAGVSRGGSFNSQYQNISNVIGRYWMVSANFRFLRHSGLK
jgi:hypothetical protein